MEMESEMSYPYPLEYKYRYMYLHLNSKVVVKWIRSTYAFVFVNFSLSDSIRIWQYPTLSVFCYIKL
jgi:hypothetical protein